MKELKKKYDHIKYNAWQDKEKAKTTEPFTLQGVQTIHTIVKLFLKHPALLFQVKLVCFATL
jgi:hypothetical protein